MMREFNKKYCFFANFKEIISAKSACFYNLSCFFSLLGFSSVEESNARLRFSLSRNAEQ